MAAGDISPVAAFCADLRRRWRASGRDLASVAREMRMSRAQLYAILKGEVKRPPDLGTVVQPLIRACGGTDAELEDWRRRHEVLVEVHAELRRQPTGRSDRPAPAQLPADVEGFAGRRTELDQLDALLARGRDRLTTVVVAAVSGPAGVGKTALALHWAHRVRRDFPDGQLYVNLAGFDPDGVPMEPGDALRGFLDALPASGGVPADLRQRAAAYRSALDGRRMLIVLDNARDAAQIRPLLPGSAGCLVIVTSRNPLTGLIAGEGAHPLSLGLMAHEEAHDLLVHRLGKDRLAAEPDAADDIIDRCARLPLALAIAAARAATHPGFTLATLAAELEHATGTLDAFAIEDSATDVRTVFSWSYRVLSPAAARLFRLLGLHPGPEITVGAAASLAGLPADGARRRLAELTNAHLLIEHIPGRYTLHDLLRAYAVELARIDDADRDAALYRLLDHYLHSAYAAARRLGPHRDPITIPAPHDGTVVDGVRAEHQALTWFAAEYRMLLGAVELAVRHRFAAYVEPLAWTLTDFLQRKGYWHEQTDVHAAALTATQSIGDRVGEARSHRQLSRALILLDRLDDAYAHYRQALELAEQMGDEVGQAHVRLNAANLLERQGRYAEALEHADKALALFAETDNRSGHARARNMVGWFHARQGRYADGLDHCEQALAELQQIGDGQGQIHTLDSIGYARRHLGQHDEAVAAYRRAIRIAEELGDRRNVAEVLVHLSDVYEALGDAQGVRDCRQQALDILDDFDDPDAEQVRATLGEQWNPRPRRPSTT